LNDNHVITTFETKYHGTTKDYRQTAGAPATSLLMQAKKPSMREKI